MKPYHLLCVLLTGLLLATAAACRPAVPSPSPTAALAMPTATREQVEPEAVDAEPYANPLAAVELVLGTTLPAEPVAATVFRLTAPTIPSVADVRQLAARFGVPGELYHEVPPSFAGAVDVTEEDISQTPLIYYAFSNARTFFFSFYGDEIRIEYVDRFVPISYKQADFLPFEQAAPIAEAFLQERDLLNFSYQITPGSSGDVQFLRLVNGQPVITQPEFTAYVDAASLVYAVSYFSLQSLAPLGEHPSRSAADAWQLVLQATGDQFTYSITPEPANLLPAAAPSTETQSLWHRTYQAGQQASVYGHTTMYRPVESGDPPRIRLDWFWIQGTEPEIQALAEHAQQFVHVWGTVHVDASNSWSLELAGSETVSVPDPGYQSLAGTIQIADGQTLFHTDEGQILLLPDAPFDLTHDQRVWVHGPAIESADGPHSLFQWSRIESYNALATVAPATGDEMPTLSQAVIARAELVYVYKAAHGTGFTDRDGSPVNLLVPAWRFVGTTNNGEVMEIIVQAVADELLVDISEEASL